MQSRIIKKIIFVVVLNIVIRTIMVSSLTAVDLSNKIGIGLGYPYLSLKYGFSPGFTAEIRDAFGSGINVFGGRGYFNFYVGEDVISFLGLEYGHITFDTEDIAGDGSLFIPFIGGEIFTSPNFSIGLDIGPAFIKLKSGELSSGQEWVANLDVNFYFGKGHGTDTELGHRTDTEQKPIPPVIAPPIKLTNIAVADFSANNVSAADASIIAGFLRTELVKIGGFNVIEKANMDKILAEAAFQQSGCTTSECAVQIGKILNVRQIVVGSLSKLMDTYFITVNLVEVETGKILRSEKIKAYSADGISDACKTLAEKLTE